MDFVYFEICFLKMWPKVGDSQRQPRVHPLWMKGLQIGLDESPNET